MRTEKLLFTELPIECKYALLEYTYMMFETLEEVEEYYKEFTFNLEFIDIEKAKVRCMDKSEDLWGCKTFEEYHQMYVEGADIPNHGKSIYPVIESNDSDDWLLDGWHRFHSYVMYGHKTVPVLSFN